MTLELVLKQPNASILYSLASFPAWLVSPEAFEKFGAGMQRNPVGTGPYRFSSWQQNQAIIYEKNEDYWGDPAKFARLVIRSVPENTVRLLELKAGKIHGLDGLQPAELADLIDDPQFTVHHHPGMNVGYMAICDFVERLKHREVRRAIAMAIDRQAIVDLALDGWGVVAEYPMPPGFLGEPAGEAPISHDPDAARAILAGHPEVTGTPISLHTINAPRPYFPDPTMIASLIRSDLESVGLTVNIVTKDFKSHLHDMRQGNFEMGLLGWSGDNGDPDNFLATFFASWAAVKGMANNISFYRNVRMDELLLKARAETSIPERQKIYEKALALWARDMPLIPLVSTEQIVVMRREATGFRLSRVANIFLGPVGWAQRD
jgi:peptide/nickel transport system substrate-binding protein